MKTPYGCMSAFGRHGGPRPTLRGCMSALAHLPAAGRTCRLLTAFLIALLAALPAFAESSISVSLDRPDPFTPVSGPVTIEAVVVAEETIERVAFYVDGVVVGELEEPPYTLATDVGDDNVEHRFQVVAYGESGATGSGSLRTPAFRVDEVVSITLQQLYVTVTSGGERLTDLTRDDFVVYDEGERQRIVTFARGDVPFTAAVLVDSSVSMEGHKLRSALAGAEAFFRGMQRLDEGKLLVFSDRILHATPFTTFQEVLTAGLSRVTARGGTALNDHLYLALKQLESRQGRRVVVLLSDGVDSHSVLQMAEVAANARRSQALIYWLRLPYRDGDAGAELPSISSPWRSREEYRREYEALRRTVEESGGRVEPLSSLDEITPAFAGILAELREQYVLGFYPERARHDGGWRRLSVRVRPQGAEVRCREGYVDY